MISLNISNIYAQTTIDKINGNWELLVNGKPFEVKGVTFGYDNDIDNYDAHFKDLKFQKCYKSKFHFQLYQ